MTNIAIRRQLRDALAWGDAHVTFDNAVQGIPSRFRGVVPAGMPHSAWELVEHVRLAQADILEFCVNPRYRSKPFPDAYWPKSAAPRDANHWRASLDAFRRDRRSLERLAVSRTFDLEATVPAGDGQTNFRELVLVLDHTAYHVGQLVLVRRALGIWSNA